MVTIDDYTCDCNKTYPKNRIPDQSKGNPRLTPYLNPLVKLGFPFDCHVTYEQYNTRFSRTLI